MITIFEAILSLSPDAKVSVVNNNMTKVVWESEPISEAEIQAEVTRLQAVYDSQEYARKRKAEYDKLNQDELRFDDLENGTTTWVDSINAIKARYPK